MTETTHKKAIRSSVFRIYELVITVVISILLTPFIVNKLGIEAYGLWILILSIMSWNEIIDMGITSAIQRSYGGAISNREDDKINLIFSNAIMLLACLGLLPFTVFIILASFPAGMGITENLYTEYSIVMVALAFQMYLRFLMNSVHGLFAGILRLDLIAKVDTAAFLLRSAAIVILLLLNYGFYGVAIGYFFATTLSDLVKYIIIKRHFPSLSFHFNLFSKPFIADLFQFGLQVFRDKIATIISTKSNNIVISQAGFFTSLGGFGLYQTLATYYTQVVSIPITAYQALIIKIQSRGYFRLHANIVTEATIILTYTSVVFGCVLAVYSAEIIKVWIGPGIQDYSLTVYLLFCAVVLELAAKPLHGTLYASGQLKYLPNVSLVMAIINVTASFFIIKQFGVQYITFMLMVMNAIKAFILYPNLVSSICKINWTAYHFRNFRISLYLLAQYFYVADILTLSHIEGFFDLFIACSAYFVLIGLVLLLDILVFEAKTVANLLLFKKIRKRLKRRVAN
jgi:O-antigen/teichoic acid export membrane protein